MTERKVKYHVADDLGYFISDLTRCFTIAVSQPNDNALFVNLENVSPYSLNFTLSTIASCKCDDCQDSMKRVLDHLNSYTFVETTEINHEKEFLTIHFKNATIKETVYFLIHKAITDASKS